MLQEFIIFALTIYNLGFAFEEKDSPWLTIENEDLEDVCLTKECIISAERIIENLDMTVNPCEDFYQFACGGYGEKTLADDYRTVHVDSELDETMKAQLKKMIEQSKSSFTGSSYKMKDMYDSCTNVAHMRELGLKPLKDFLNYYGGWPVVLGSKWNEDKFDWKTVVSEMIGDALPVNLIPFSLEINQGHLNTDMHLLPVIRVPESQPQSLRNRSWVNDTLINNPLIAIAVLLGASEDDVQQEMEEVYAFRSSLNELLDFKSNESVSNNICANLNFDNVEKANTTTIEELYSITDKIEWLSFMQRAFSPMLTMQSEVICVGSSDVFARLIETYDNTSKRVLANYIFSGLARSYMQYIKSDQWDEIIMNSRSVYIPQRPISRWRICLPIVHNYFLPVLTSLFVQHNHKFKEKEHIVAMFQLIRKELRILLDSVKWLNDDTLENGKKRIDDLIAFLAYPDEVLDDKFLDEFFRELTISPYDFLKNIWHLNKFQHKKTAEYYDKTIIKNHWTHQATLLLTNAFYKPFYNTIEIPASQTRESYFSMNRPQALNFGSLGAIIGHEVLHAVNQIGVPIRPEIPTVKWWIEDDVVAFRKRAQCTINQYGRYGLLRHGKLNGSKTLDENIADNTGVMISYKAYQSWLKDHPGNDARLPGLLFNNNQLFWISYANSWCFSYSFSRRIPNLSRLTHSWPVFRVKGSVSNSPDFAKDFNCPLNSPMNPEIKCSVW